METVTLSKTAIKDLVKLKEELDVVVESLELMSNEAFMASYNEAKEQIKNREFDEWNEL